MHLFLGLGLPEMLISLRIKLFLSSKAWFYRSRRRHTILTCDGRRDPLQNAEFYRATVSYEDEPFICFFPEWFSVQLRLFTRGIFTVNWVRFDERSHVTMVQDVRFVQVNFFASDGWLANRWIRDHQLSFVEDNVALSRNTRYCMPDYIFPQNT